MNKGGCRVMEVLQAQEVAVLQGGQETLVFEVQSLGFVSPACLCCRIDLQGVDDDSQRD